MMGSDHCPAMKGMIGAQRGCARVGRGERKEATSAGRPTTVHLIVAPCASAACAAHPSRLLPLASHPSCLTPRAPFASHPSCRAPLTPRRHPLYGRSVAAPYVAARLAPLPRAHRLIGAAPLETAGAGHLRRGDVRRFAMPDEDGESTMIGHGTFPRAQRARCCVRPRGGGRRRAGSEGGHPGAAMTNAICCVWSM